jgi:hypothetical protein
MLRGVPKIQYATTKPFSASREVVLKQPLGNKRLVDNNGGDHALNHPQRNPPRVSEQCRARNSKLRNAAVTTELVAALLASVSASIFLAHAYDAYGAKPTARNVVEQDLSAWRRTAHVGTKSIDVGSFRFP